ncbi:TetR family transcriptional regulator [Antricoccus suffuscus]|uniref:TetR family transcriptional regulator n=1 Tax=Antricoccus suffuscus TaxID=1629062 RepID=A0A2T0ZXD6_9ACTN|nr:TetR/AcrR family transcriptional regulator [Antricoccus suffuscus]PRZ41025.1 TetR family transcriptional regulator [Antricoccus suffuscus]
MTTTPTPRALARARTEDSILQLAHAQLDGGGVEALSLRAIARELGIVSSAIYRYCASREALITMLVIDAYRSLGAAVTEAEGAIARNDYRGRLRATIGAIRGWALRYPNRYALIYGTPVPGYRAPEDTIGPAALVAEIVLAVAADLYAAGHKPQITHALKTAAPGFADLARNAGTSIPPSHVALVVEIWTRMYGIVSFELFGQYINVVGDAETYYDFVADDMARRLGAPPR